MGQIRTCLADSKPTPALLIRLLQTRAVSAYRSEPLGNLSENAVAPSRHREKGASANHSFTLARQADEVSSHSLYLSDTSGAARTRTDYPATFRARGLSVPFTTPALAAARLRESRHRGLELVVPNPLGKYGSYILELNAIRTAFAPTVHDAMLARQLSGFSSVGPTSLREAAVTVAMEGYAGVMASAAARAALAADRLQKTQAQYQLMRGLIQRCGFGPVQGASRDTGFDQQAGLALARLSRELHRPAAQLATVIGSLGTAFGPIGMQSTDHRARIPASINRLEEAAASLTAWREAAPQHDVGGLAQPLAAAMRTAARNGGAALASIRQILSDPLALLRRRLSDPMAVAALGDRCSWLMDGWDRVALLWQAAETIGDRRSALLEMAQCLPVLPREALEWTDPAMDVRTPDQSCHITMLDSVWNKGRSAIALTRRNEKLRAMGL